MRTFVAGLLAASFLVTNAFAADAPLPSGKPAGVRAAQDPDNSLLFVLGVGAIAAGAIILATQDSDSKLVTGTVPTTGT